MSTVNASVIFPTFPSTTAENCDSTQLDSVAVKVIKTAAYSALLLLSLVGNSVVPAVVYRNPKLHTSINYFIASMSVSDLLIPIFAIPERIKQIYVPQLIWQIDGVFGSILCKFTGFMPDTSTIVTVLSLIIVSFERFFAVVYPMKTQPFRSKKSCFIVIAFTWVFALLCSSQHFYTWRLKTVNGTTFCFQSWKPAFVSDKVPIVELLVFQICFVMIPFVVLVGLYCPIIVSLQRKKNRGQLQSNQRRHIEKKYRHITYMLLRVVVLFLVPCIAVSVYLFLDIYVWNPSTPCNARHTSFTLVYLAFVNRAFNPYIYCIYNRRYRKAFRKIFCYNKNVVCCKRYCRETKQEVSVGTNVQVQLRTFTE